MLLTPNAIVSLLAEDGYHAAEIIPIDRGWLNQLWRVATDRGDLLVKAYSPRRYDGARLPTLEEALQRQIYASEKGTPCPRILTRNGRVARTTASGEAYTVMTFCPRMNLCETTITEAQLYDLGAVCARLHRIFSELSPASVKGYSIHTNDTVLKLRAHMETRLQMVDEEDLPLYRQSLMAQIPLVEQLPENAFSHILMGIAHEDFTPDNLLFYDEV